MNGRKYEVRHRLLTFMAASVSQNGRFRAVFLSVIMVLMTQVGYTDNMDFSIGLNQDTESKDTGGSTPALTPSVEGADLMVGDLMDEITFQTGSAGYSGSNTSSTLLSGYVSVFSPMGNYLYFTYDDGVHGYELWKTDGTTAGTSMVVDFNNGSGHGWGQSFTGSHNQGAHYVHGNTLYYQCHDGNGSSNTKFCKTDGTAAGTVVLHSNLDVSRHTGNHNWAHIGNTVYFLADDGTHGKELWKTDGTANGTVLVKDIYVGAGDITGYNSLLQMVAFQNHIYLFSSYHPSNPPAYMNSTSGGLWKSDGTTSGTVFFMPGEMQQLSVIANKLFFRCMCGSAFGTNGVKIVASDGTYSGSTHFDALTHATYDWEFMHAGDTYEPRRVKAELNGYAFYGGDDSNGYFQLYKTDGTANGSTKVTNFSNGTELYEVSQYCKCIYGWVIGNTLYFQVNDVTTGNELWKTDGTTSGTKIVKDINVGSGDAFSSSNNDYHIIGDTLFFNADDGTHGVELWRTNGTASGTMMVEDFNPSGNSANGWILNAGTSILNIAYNGSVHVRSYDPANIGGILSSFNGANCTVSPALPTGLSIDSSTCTISGTPTVETSNTTYTVTANISGTTYQGTVWLATVPFGTITSPVMGAELDLGEAMTPITLNYTVNANASTGSTSSTSLYAYANNKVDTDYEYTCAILGNGDLKCWGIDNREQLGDGVGQTNINSPPSTAIDLGSGRTAKAVSTGFNHACALLDNGDIKCWGDADEGQLGTGVQYATHAVEASPPSTAINLGSGRTAVAVTAGRQFSCAILDNGEVKCWGLSYHGALGTGSTNLAYPTPSPAIDLGTGRTAVAISAGRDHACAILDNGELKCWGWDVKGQLGDGGSNHDSSSRQSSPTTVNLGSGRTAIAVSGGYQHTCAVLDNGDVRCWGAYSSGRLGIGHASCVQNICTEPHRSWMAVDLGTGRTAVAVTAGVDHTCAILDNGDVKCWGSDQYGQLGTGLGSSNGNNAGFIGSPPATPIDLGTGRTAVAISAGRYHTCAILDNGEMNCWGYNIRGQLGDGNSTVHPHVEKSPVLVAGSNSWDTTTTLVTWETHPALPAGMSISNGVISGTPSVYAVNQTYTIYANQSGETTTFDMYFSVDTNNPHTVVENQPIDAIGFQDPFQNGTTNWTVSPALQSMETCQ